MMIIITIMIINNKKVNINNLGKINEKEKESSKW